ncbi:RNA polymerase sigma factor [Streptomyces viridochromogenes]|uniref:RNA polymerase sigma factor n=1 Tax=Streptomyces viridochromogenes TaxID=1938 RepID=UPI00131CB5E1|nr:sigma-70 family RNA polymerase sigma factor [Streptomyces viridochromogenes]
MPSDRLSTAEQQDYDDFFRAEFTPITRHVLSLGASIEEAKDAAQATLLDLLKNWHSVRAPRAWCRKAAANHYLRSEMRANRGLELSRQEFIARRGEDAHNLASSLEEWEFVIDFVQKHLTGAQRIIMAWHLDGYTPREIAQVLNKDMATVRSNLRHARIKLASALKNEYPELTKPT